jgi:hypothetical protein
VFVAIVGGFLVSRLVAISSERDGLRRRHKQVRDQLEHVAFAYQEAHEYRLRNSQNDFRRWMLDQFVLAAEPIDREALLNDRIPRGSSRTEMEPYLERLIERAKEVSDEVAAQVARGDTRQLSLQDLEDRGLVVRDDERDIYLKVVDSIASQHPRASSEFGPMADFRMPIIRSAQAVATETRRLDESIREEQELHTRMRMLETEAARLRAEITLVGRPLGVVPAIAILAAYSLVGIVVPVVVLTLNPKRLLSWQAWSLVALFVVGLFTVLLYILWYVRTLNSAAAGDEDQPPRSATREPGGT